MSHEWLRTPLHEMHLAFGGRMVEFAGWSMPVMFRGINDEHIHTRTVCSVFDVSHMGRLRFTGADCESLLNRVCTRNLTDAHDGRCYYSHVCREDGGILDDVIVTRFTDHWGMVCNASNREKIVHWLRKHAEGRNVELIDETLNTAMLAIQGPKTLELAEELTGRELSKIKRYHAEKFSFMGLELVVYRSGYTGEDGLEVVFPAVAAKTLAPFILGTQEKPHPTIRPAGLGARDTLRIEAAMPLYGHELFEEVDSLTAGQAWCVDLKKDFIGAAAMRRLQDQGLRRHMVGLELDGKRIARQNQKVLAKGQEVGMVTSGTLSPTLGKSIAMAFLASELCPEGTNVDVEISGKPVAARVVKLPFYQRSTNKKN